MDENMLSRGETESDFPAHQYNLDNILDCLNTLTPREREILSQVLSGRLNKQIASELGISIRTVKAHRARVMQKMEADSLAELVTMIVTLQIYRVRMMTNANR